ncbi:MAG TPA: cation/acetate symporter ActP [Xanthomonadales bacterium]|nr:cation/acetate symporter ActP [Xanthomonadales bacterium]
MNITAILMFFVFVALTLAITWWAALRTHTRADFYAAGKNIGGLQNGLAIAGDFMSAATFLGISALVYSAGMDGMLFVLGGTLGWAVILLLVAERLRNLGKYTFSDVVAFRLERGSVRTMSAVGALAVAIPYLLAQMVGAGALIQILFGMPYAVAVVIVGVLMTLYVTFGGMIATTWVQTIKAVLLLTGGTIMGFGVMSLMGFDFGSLITAAVNTHPQGQAIMAPGVMFNDTITIISIGLAFVFGTAGLPHVLMRFFTVPDARQARRSVAYAIGFIGYFQSLIFIIGLGAIVYVSKNPEFLAADGSLIGGSNMSAVHLSKIIGGDLFLGFISAVAFATILAVVSGLTLSAAAAVSHDLYANVIRHGNSDEKTELRISRITTLVIGLATMALSILLEGENVAVLALIALAIAASVNFPVLFLSMYWSRFTTRGALAGGYAGLAVSLLLVMLGPTVWVSMLGFERPIYPYAYPTLFAMLANFILAYWFSVTDKSHRAFAEVESFDAQWIQSEIGPTQKT